MLIEDCYGNTAKKYDALFIKNNWMNNKMYEPNRCNYDLSYPEFGRNLKSM